MLPASAQMCRSHAEINYIVDHREREVVEVHPSRRRQTRYALHRSFPLVFTDLDLTLICLNLDDVIARHASNSYGPSSISPHLSSDLHEWVEPHAGISHLM